MDHESFKMISFPPQMFSIYESKNVCKMMDKNFGSRHLFPILYIMCIEITPRSALQPLIAMGCSIVGLKTSHW